MLNGELTVCRKYLVPKGQNRRNNESLSTQTKFLPCILAKKFQNINFLKPRKEAGLKITCNSNDRGPYGINGLRSPNAHV